MTILLLEDDDLVARGFTRLLQGAGHTVRRARTLGEAREALHRSPPVEVAVIDIGLEDGECGLEILNEIRNHHAGVFRLLMSGGVKASPVLDGSPREVFLPKPFGFDELEKALASFWRQRRTS